MTLIDTSAWIEFLRKTGRSDVKNRVAGYLDLGEAAYCGPIAFELLSGARDSELADIHTMFHFSTLLDFPFECWRAAAEAERHLRTHGITVPRDDIFVASAALHHNIPVYTCDPHFILLCEKGQVPLRLA